MEAARTSVILHTATPAQQPCIAHRTHEPHLSRTVGHHILPQETQLKLWGSIPFWVLAYLDDVTHYNVHGVLNGYVTDFRPSHAENLLIRVAKGLTEAAVAGWKPEPEKAVIAHLGELVFLMEAHNIRPVGWKRKA